MTDHDGTTVGFRRLHELSRAGEIFTVPGARGVGAALYTFSQKSPPSVIEGGMTYLSGGAGEHADRHDQGSLHRLRVRPESAASWPGSSGSRTSHSW